MQCQCLSKNTVIFIICVLAYCVTGGVCELTPVPDPLTVDEIVGAYAVETIGGAADSIYLNDDFTYVRIYGREGDSSTRDVGRWTLLREPSDSGGRNMHLKLYSFHMRIGGEIGSQVTGHFYADSAVDVIYCPIKAHVYGGRKYISFGRSYEYRWEKNIPLQSVDNQDSIGSPSEP